MRPVPTTVEVMEDGDVVVRVTDTQMNQLKEWVWAFVTGGEYAFSICEEHGTDRTLCEEELCTSDETFPGARNTLGESFSLALHELALDLLLLAPTTTLGGDERDAAGMYVKHGADHIHITEDDPRYQEYWNHIAEITNTVLLGVVHEAIRPSATTHRHTPPHASARRAEKEI
jgi:hypothetical protein